MKERKTKIVVLGIVLNSKGEILISQRIDPKFKGAHLKWDVPGGTNEFGESLEDTLKREIFEETNLRIRIVSMLSKCQRKTWSCDEFIQHTLLFCYICRVESGKVRLRDRKIKQLRWMDREEIEKYDFLLTTKKFIEIYQKA